LGTWKKGKVKKVEKKGVVSSKEEGEDVTGNRRRKGQGKEEWEGER
jgi:hypothetical protein